MKKGQAGIRWNRAVEKVWKELGENQDERMSAGTGGARDKNQRHDGKSEEEASGRTVDERKNI